MTSADPSRPQSKPQPCAAGRDVRQELSGIGAFCSGCRTVMQVQKHFLDPRLPLHLPFQECSCDVGLSHNCVADILGSSNNTDNADVDLERPGQ